MDFKIKCDNARDMAEDIVCCRWGQNVPEKYADISIFMMQLVILHVMLHYDKSLRSCFTLLSIMSGIAYMEREPDGFWVSAGVFNFDAQFDALPEKDELKKEYMTFRSFVQEDTMVWVANFLQEKLLWLLRNEREAIEKGLKGEYIERGDFY